MSEKAASVSVVNCVQFVNVCLFCCSLYLVHVFFVFLWEEFLFKEIIQKKIHTHTCTLYTICLNSGLPLKWVSSTSFFKAAIF